MIRIFFALTILACLSTSCVLPGGTFMQDPCVNLAAAIDDANASLDIDNVEDVCNLLNLELQYFDAGCVEGDAIVSDDGQVTREDVVILIETFECVTPE